MAGKPGLVGKSPCGLNRVSRQDDREFLTAYARGNPTLGAGRLTQFGRENGNDAIAQRMTMRVVDDLEVIDVAQNKRQGLSHAFRFFDCSFRTKLEAASVEQRRKLVRFRADQHIGDQLPHQAQKQKQSARNGKSSPIDCENIA